MDTRQIIPTTYKAKLPGELSFPLGAEALANALRGVPQFDHLEVSFRDRPVSSAVAFRETLRAGTPHVVLQASFRKRAGGVSAPRQEDVFWKAFYALRWELVVYPVLRQSRHAARLALLNVGLSDLRRWLSHPESMRWKVGHKRREYLFDPKLGTLHIRDRGEILS